MNLFNELNLKAVTDQPTVWIRKVVIYEQIDPEPVVIREIPLSRGLNIVWADEPEDDDPDAEITGHSAGKTGFCRLVRYLLGETTFGTKTNTGFIRKALSKGYVGAELFVREKQLSVIRPLGTGRASYIQSDKTLAELLSNRGYPVYHENYLSSLGVSAILDDLESGGIVRTGETIQWGHLLAWITRDQEARFQNIYEWRSPRSESDSPRFQFPKAGPLFVMRTVLGLILPDELKAEEQLAELTRRQLQLEREQEELRREPQFRVNLYERQLRQKLVELDEPSADVKDMALESDGLIAGLDKLAEGAAVLLESKIAPLEEQAEQQQNEIDDLGADIRSLDRQKDQLDALLGLGQTATSELDQGLRQRRNERSLQEKYRNEKCLMGGVLYSECTYVQARRDTLKKTQLQDAQSLEQAEAERQRELNQVEADKNQIQHQLDDLENDRRTLLDQSRQIRREIKEKNEDLRDLKRVHKALAEWHAKATDLEGFGELAKCKEELTDIAKTVANLESQLNELIGEHESHRDLLNQIFSASVRAVLPSGTYDGTVRLDGRELNYQINHGPAMSGEAVETLSVLLSDISNLVYSSVSESAHLPEFLLHDSPREADLGIRIYWNFIRFVACLQHHFESADNCPFQYILTTTTPPPPELSNDDFVKLPLDASKPEGLLYKRDLSTAATLIDEQTNSDPNQSELPFTNFSETKDNSPKDDNKNSTGGSE